VAFVESPIDALSLREFGFSGTIVATVGNAPETARQLAENYRSQGMTIVAAFDNDRAGGQMAHALGYPHETLKPRGKDWNQDLMAFKTDPQGWQTKQRQRERSRGLER
jgi:DNA primase